MADPENRQPSSRWQQIGIALLASALTAMVTCGGGGFLISRNSKFGQVLGGLLVALGLVSIFIFVVAVVFAIVKGIVTLVKK
jgi:hypothetical protein